jgi:hypothetical protein
VISQATVAVAKYTSSVKGAQQSRQRILKELSLISQTLTGLKLLIDDLSAGDADVVGTDAAAAVEITTGLSTLEGSEGPLAECRQTVADVLAWLNRHVSAEVNLAQKLVWPIRDEKKVDEVRKELERQKSQFILALEIASAGRQNLLSRKADAITARTESIYERVGDIANEQLRVQQENAEQERGSPVPLCIITPPLTMAVEEQFNSLISRLDPAPYEAKHQASARVRQENTCKWVLENSHFQAWLNWSTPFIWLNGIRE